MLGFNYTFQIVEDGNYGSLNKETGKWNGMIKELQDGVSLVQLVSSKMKWLS